MDYRYNYLICAGTFDMLHEGHKAFIRYAFLLSRQVYITITSDIYTKKYKPHASSFSKRKKDVENFLEKEGLLARATIQPIDDVFGISLDQQLPVDAVLVSGETQKGAAAINQERVKKGLPQLAIVIMPFVKGQHSAPISSTAIRKGIIDTSGSVFIDPSWTGKIHYLPLSLRKELQKPFGQLLSSHQIPHNLSNNNLITVGDITTQLFHEKGYRQRIAIVDFVVERKETHESFADLGFEDNTYKISYAQNPSATLTPELWEKIKDGIESEKETVVVVKGEEDLAVIPCILLAPLGYQIFYGQPRLGLVCVQVTIDMKKRAYVLLRKFL